MSNFSANRFALLSESDDEGSAPAATAKAPEVAAQPAKPIAAPTSKPKAGPTGAPRGRGSDYPSRGGARNVYREDRDAQPAAGGGGGGGGGEDGREPRGERGGRGRGGPRGGRGALGRGRGGRGGAKSERPDRHSATGVTDTDKKVASGWGADEGKQELQAETDGWGDAKAEASVPGTPGAANGAAATGSDPANAPAAPVVAEETPAPPAEEEDNTKTLDEYLAERAAAAKIGSALEARKANEGADDAQWKDGIQLLKGDTEDQDWFMGAKNESKKAPASNPKKAKTFIEVEPVGYRPPRTDRGGARGGARGGDRGGDRGGRGRGEGRGRGAPRGSSGFGGPRGGRGGAQSREINTDDASAFPSLS